MNRSLRTFKRGIQFKLLRSWGLQLARNLLAIDVLLVDEVQVLVEASPVPAEEVRLFEEEEKVQALELLQQSAPFVNVDPLVDIHIQNDAFGFHFFDPKCIFDSSLELFFDEIVYIVLQILGIEDIFLEQRRVLEAAHRNHFFFLIHDILNSLQKVIHDSDRHEGVAAVHKRLVDQLELEGQVVADQVRRVLVAFAQKLFPLLHIFEAVAQEFEVAVDIVRAKQLPDFADFVDPRQRHVVENDVVEVLLDDRPLHVEVQRRSVFTQDSEQAHLRVDDAQQTPLVESDLAQPVAVQFGPNKEKRVYC